MRRSEPVSGEGRITRAIARIVYGGVGGPDDVELRRRYAMIAIISLIGIVTIVVLGFVAWAQNNPLLGILDHIVALILVVNLFVLRLTRRYYLAAATGISIVAALFIFLLVTGGVKGTGHLWFYTFPLIASFLLGSRGGLISSLFVLALAVLHLTLFSGEVSWVRIYEGEFVIRFVPSFLVVLAYAYFFERFREESHRDLTRRNRELAEARGHLAEKVDERTAELRQSQARFATVLDSIDANVYAADMTTHEILFMNRRMVEDMGHDAIGQQCFSALRAQSAPCNGCTNPRLLDEDGQPTGVLAWTARNQRTGRWYLHHDRAVEWVDGRYVRLQVATDLTVYKEAEAENVRLQGRLAQAQKMEAIGTLAGGVAHDLNNILTAILGYPDLMLRDLPEDSPLQVPLETIRGSAQKCSRIVSDLLTLARRGVSHRDPVELSGVAEEFLRSPEHRALVSTHPAVELEARLSEDIPAFYGSRVHVFTTVLNLMSNAYEAMSEGGRLTLETSVCRLDEPHAGLATVPTGDYALLRVTDTGIGLSPEEIGRVFEPFYTRKAMGRSGSGLGMAVVWGAVVDHGGYVDVRSTPGEGSEFEVYFPLSGTPAPSTKPEESEVPSGAGEHILVVDDDETQCELTTEILTQVGYRVDTVSSGEEAVEFVRRERPRLLLLDMIMDPGIDGLETYRRITEFAPDQRAIIVSGYAETDRVAEAQKLGAGAYLKKPYLIDELAAAVRRELTETGSFPSHPQ